MAMDRLISTFLLILFNNIISSHFTFAFNLHQFQFPSDRKTWALLVAGSNDYENYRHQADVCHAYHLLHSQGIPDEQIVVMMYDDIAYNKNNPNKGEIINRPNGINVYKNVLKDYTKDDVTPTNYLNVLQGKKAEMKNIGSGKVIASGPDDHIFVYFADHGAPGMVAFPNAELYATDLMKAIENMHKNKQYDKMVIYFEACESGSMFENLLPNNISVFAVTAANPREPSFACYYDEKRQTYLGDVFSVHWIEDSERQLNLRETIADQFNLVKNRTNTSHVQEYGDLSIGRMELIEFQGATPHSENLPFYNLEAVPSHEVPVMSLKRQISFTNCADNSKRLKKRLNIMLRNRKFLGDTVRSVITKATFTQSQVDQILENRFELINFECYETAAKHFSENCFSPSKNDYAMRYMYTLVNLCETGISATKINQAIDEVCILPPVHGIV